jgi:hypothetical protein
MMMYMVNRKLIHRSNAITISIFNYSSVEIGQKSDPVSIIVCCYCCSGTCLFCQYQLMMMYMVSRKLILRSNANTVSIFNYSSVEIGSKSNPVYIIEDTHLYFLLLEWYMLYYEYHLMMMSMGNRKLKHRPNAITISIFSYSSVEIAPKSDPVSIIVDTPLFVAIVVVVHVCFVNII